MARISNQLQEAIKATSQNTYEPLPKGEYIVKINSIEDRANAQGTGRHYKVVMTVEDGRFAGRKIFSNWNHSNTSVRTVNHCAANISSLWRATGHITPFPDDTDELVGLVAKVNVTIKEDEEKKYPPQNNIESGSFKPLSNYMRQRLWADGFNSKIISILKDTLKIDFKVAEQYDDTQRNTDFIGEDARGLDIRVAARLLTSTEFYHNSMFTLREREIPKIENGFGDYMFVGYINDSNELFDWHLLSLDVLRRVGMRERDGIRGLGELHGGLDNSYYVFEFYNINDNLIVA